MSKREMKKQKKRKIISLIENIVLFISFTGVLGLIAVIFLAPQIVDCGNYYAALFACIAAVLLTPALAFVEVGIEDNKKQRKKK